MALKNGFSVLLFVPPAPKVLAEIKRIVYSAFCPLILQFDFSHYFIENKVYYDMAWLPHYIIFQINKEYKIDRPELIGLAKGRRRLLPLIEIPPVIKRMTTESRGVFSGDHWAMAPPFGSPGLQNCIEK